MDKKNDHDDLEDVKNYIGSLNKNKHHTLNYNDYLDQTNMSPDLFSNIELRNTYQSENNFVLNIRNFSGLNVLTLNIQSLPIQFEELKLFLDGIEKSGDNLSGLVLQEIYFSTKIHFKISKGT